MNPNSIPKELKKIVDSEETDFLVKSRRNYPKKQGVALLIFAIAWNSFLVIFFKQSMNSFNYKNNPSDSLDMIFNVFQNLTILIFSVSGIGILIWSLVLLMQKGGYFAGTKTRFIKFRKGKITIKDWEQFSGNIKIENKGIYGNLEFELRTGKIKSSKSRPSKFIPDIIYMTGIKNVFNIEKKCRIRIKENDPTPSKNINEKD